VQRTLVRLVYLLEPGLGLLRARRIRTAIGDLVRVPPLRHDTDKQRSNLANVNLCFDLPRKN
jgi:hypothetical protein